MALLLSPLASLHNTPPLSRSIVRLYKTLCLSLNLFYLVFIPITHGYPFSWPLCSMPMISWHFPVLGMLSMPKSGKIRKWQTSTSLFFSSFVWTYSIHKTYILVLCSSYFILLVCIIITNNHRMFHPNRSYYILPPKTNPSILYLSTILFLPQTFT